MILIARIIHMIFGVYTLGLVVYSLLSWVRTPTTIGWQRWLGRYYEPVLQPIRRRIRPVVFGGMAIDLSTLILLLVLMVAKSMVISLLVPGF